MPIIPNIIERLILRSNKIPAPLFMDLPAVGVFHAVSLAVKLGVFEALKDGPMSPGEVAQKTGAEERGVGILLGGLDAFGYVRRKQGRYANSSTTAKWLLRDSETNVAPFFVDWWRDVVFPFWDSHLEESIRQGKPSTTIYDWLNQHPEHWPVAQTAFEALAPAFGFGLLSKVKLPPAASRLLDLGGGHGRYSIYFCNRYPRLTATVFDQAEALVKARKNIAASGMGGRVLLQPGDFWKDDVGTGYDVALLFNIIHAYLPERNMELLQKVAGALNPGGLVIIWDQFAERGLGPASRALERFFALTFLVTMGGQTHSTREVSRWLRASGFEKPRRLFLRPIILATKAS